MYLLAYADDIVLLAKEKESMRNMMRMLEGYIREKGLEVNVEKLKILRFRKKSGRAREVGWWKREKIDEVKSFKYLGFIFQRNGRAY